MSMRHLGERIRKNRTILIVSAIAFLFGSGSFMAGYLAALEYQPTPIVIEKCASTS